MDLKLQAAQRAIEFVKSGQVLGLGTGSTAEKFFDLLGERVASGQLRDIRGIPTSNRTEAYARDRNIPLHNIDTISSINIAIDGADEVDRNLNLTKGHGGALTREKIVASASQELIIIVDASKMVEKLGSTCALPVEVVKFGWTQVKSRIESLGAQVELRGGETKPFVTDEGNYILNCSWEGGISDPKYLDNQLNNLTGVVEHGLFLEMSSKVIVSSIDGVEILKR